MTIAARTSSINSARTELAVILAGDDMTIAPTFDAIKALPALLVDPSVTWLDGTSESGPGRVVRYQIEARVVVNYQEPIGGLADLEDQVELVLGRIPATWRFDRVDAPVHITASGGEFMALGASIYLTMRYSIET